MLVGDKRKSSGCRPSEAEHPKDTKTTFGRALPPYPGNKQVNTEGPGIQIKSNQKTSTRTQSEDQSVLSYLPTQIRFPIGGKRVTCHGSKLANSPGKQGAGADLAVGMSSGDSVEPRKLQKVGLASECQKSHFRRPRYFSEFSGGGCPWSPLQGTAFGDSYLL